MGQRVFKLLDLFRRQSVLGISKKITTTYSTIIRLKVNNCFLILKNIVNLFARLAKESVGLFDWTPYIPYVNFN